MNIFEILGVDQDSVKESIEKYGLLNLYANPEKGKQCLGEASFNILSEAITLAKFAFSWEAKRGPAITSSHEAKSAIKELIKLEIGGLEHEAFWIAYLDNKHQVIHFENLFRGTIDSSSVYPREVVKQCFLHNAAAVIIAHNHPSGSTTPSRADDEITKKLSQVLAGLNIRMLDHLIVGFGIFSYADNGML